VKEMTGTITGDSLLKAKGKLQQADGRVGAALGDLEEDLKTPAPKE